MSAAQFNCQSAWPVCLADSHVTQSAYCKHHSTETALLQVQSDVLLAADCRQCDRVVSAIVFYQFCMLLLGHETASAVYAVMSLVPLIFTLLYQL